MTAQELTPDEEQAQTVIRAELATAGEFRPFAVFDEALDCIRVIIRDCSATEVRIDSLLTVLEANYPLIEGRSEIVGFTIKGVAHLCETQKISPSAPWRLADFLDAVVKSSSSGRVLVQHLVRPLVQDKIQDIERLAA